MQEESKPNLNYMKTIMKMYNNCASIIGQSEVPYWKRIHQFLIVGAFFLLWVMCVSSMFTIDPSHKGNKPVLQAEMCTIVLQTCLIYALTSKLGAIRKCFEWCGAQYDHPNPVIKDLFEKCGAETTLMLRRIIRIVGIGGTFSLIVGQPLMLRLFNGKFTMPVPAHLPGLLPEDFKVFVLHSLIVDIAGTSMLICNILIALTLSIMINHYKTALAAMSVIIHTKKDPFEIIAKEFVEMHADLITQQDNFYDLMSILVLLNEIVAYGAIFISWFIIFFARESMVMAVVALFPPILFISIALINEDLSSAYDDLRQSIHDVNWYEMPPKDRKYLLLIMKVVDRKRLMHAGPFHVVNYELVNRFLSRVYSYGMILNSTINKA